MTIRAVHHLNCGTMCPLGAALLGQPGLGRGRLVTHCLLLETARDGLVLIDTGFGAADLAGRLPRAFRAIAAPRLLPGETAHAQITALGLSPADVRHIVVTHLDLDHAGGLSDFPTARVHLHALEHAAALARPTVRERERYVSAQWAHGPRWELHAEAGDTWRGLPAVTRLTGLDADVALVPMHGHTRGHAAIVVRAGDRWLVHAGDAYFHRSAIDGRGRPPLGLRALERAMEVDAAARRASLGALRQLRDSYADVELFCAHDPAEHARLAASA
jgi:glyoxylase-like metal-dependent hydrolase (beta-lactamase superfamily II)